MLFIKKEISGTPTLVPLTGDVAADPEGVICYVADQDKLSDPVDITSCATSDSTTFKAPYDGVLSFKASASASGFLCFDVNGCNVAINQSGNSYAHVSVQAHVNKGDTVLAKYYCVTNCKLLAQWYCDRDYDHDGSPWLSPYIANVGGGGGGDIGCQWCSTATYACITNSNNVSLANISANSVAIGNASSSTGNSAIAIGSCNDAAGDTAIVIGTGNTVCCDANIVIGEDSCVTSAGCVVAVGCAIRSGTICGGICDNDVILGSADNGCAFKLCASNGYMYSASGECLMTGRMLACPAELPASNCSLVLFYDYNGHCCLPSFYDENGNQRFLQAPDNSCYDTLGCVYTSNVTIGSGNFNVPFGSTVPAGIYRADVWLTGCDNDTSALYCIHTACNVTPTVNSNEIDHCSGRAAVWQSYPGVLKVGAGGTTNVRVNASSNDPSACVRIMLTKIGG